MEIKSMLPWKRDKALAQRDPFTALRREMDALFEGFVSDFGLPTRALEAFNPSIDMTENEKEIRVTAELPGVEERDVEISVSPDAVTIKGEKKEEKEEKGEERYRVERSYGAFRRSFSLPCAVDADKATATFKKGVLSVTLPKAAQAAKSKKIAVKSS
jgi:HSP20 family protein